MHHGEIVLEAVFHPAEFYLSVHHINGIRAHEGCIHTAYVKGRADLVLVHDAGIGETQGFYSALLVLEGGEHIVKILQRYRHILAELIEPVLSDHKTGAGFGILLFQTLNFHQTAGGRGDFGKGIGIFGDVVIIVGGEFRHQIGDIQQHLILYGLVDAAGVIAAGVVEEVRVITGGHQQVEVIGGSGDGLKHKGQADAGFIGNGL